MRWKARRPRWELKDGKYQQVLLERHVVKEIVERLWYQAKIKVKVINQPYAGKTPQNVSGIPDLVGWIPRKLLLPLPDSGVSRAIPVYIEVKRPGGVRRPAQILFIEEARADGCVAFFAESWADVMREMNEQVGLKLKEGL